MTEASVCDFLDRSDTPTALRARKVKCCPERSSCRCAGQHNATPSAVALRGAPR